MPFTAEEKRRRRAEKKKAAEREARERVERDLARIKAEAKERKAKRAAAAKKGHRKRNAYVMVDIEWRSLNVPKGGGNSGMAKYETMRDVVNARAKDVTPAWLREQVRRYVKRIADAYDEDKRAVIYDALQPDYDSIKHTVVVMEMKPDDFKDIPVKRAAPPLLMGMAQPWDRRQGTCVIDLLEHLLVKDVHNEYKVRRILPTRQSLEMALAVRCDWDVDGGVTPSMVVKLFRYLKKSVGIVDEDLLVTSSGGSANRRAIRMYYDARVDTGKTDNDTPVTWLMFTNDHIYQVKTGICGALTRMADEMGASEDPESADYAFLEFKKHSSVERSDLTGYVPATTSDTCCARSTSDTSDSKGERSVKKANLIITSSGIVDDRQFLADFIATHNVMPTAIRCDAHGHIVNFDIEHVEEGGDTRCARSLALGQSASDPKKKSRSKPKVTRVMINGDHAESKRAHEEIGEPYEGSGLNGVLRAIQKRHGCAPIKSQLSRRLLDVLTQKGIKDRARRGPVGYHPGTLLPATKEDVRDAIAGGALILDINKCYGACMYEPYDEWFVFAECDDVEPYTGPIDERAFYVVQTKDNTVLDGPNIYTRARLRLAQEEGVAFTVTHRVKASGSRPTDYFRPCLDHIHAAYGSSDPVTMKRLVTRMYGTMGTSTEVSSSLRLNTSRQHANAWFYKHLAHDADGHIAPLDPNTKLFFARLPPGRVLPELNEAHISVFSLDDDMGVPERQDERDVDDCVWLYGYQHKRHVRQSALPWYIQVADYGAMRMHYLIKDLGGYKNVIYRQTDCAVARPGVVFHGDLGARAVALAGWGGYRVVDNVNDAPAIYDAHPRPALVVPERPVWNTHDEINDSDQHEAIRAALFRNGGLLLLGAGGAGKSYVIDHIVHSTNAEHGPKACMVMAPTHAAANNVRGKTIDGSIFVTGDGRIRERALRTLRGTVKLIVVDEVSMVNLHRLRMLDRVKTVLGCPMLLVGDFSQCRAVESLNDSRMNLPGSYKDTDLMHHIVGGAVVELTKQYRAKCARLIDVLQAVREKRLERPDLPQAGPDATDAIHVVHTNQRRIRVNDDVMRAHREAGRCVAHLKADPRDIEAQDMDVWVGMPVIARETLYFTLEAKEVRLFNNERWTVTGVRTDRTNTFFAVRTVRKAPRAVGEIAHQPDVVVDDEFVGASFVKQFLPACAMTVHKIQGATIRAPQRIVVHQWGLLEADLRYTALGRVEYLSQLAFCDIAPPPLTHHIRSVVTRRIASHRQQDAKAGRLIRGNETFIDVEYVGELLRKVGDCPVCNKTIVIAPPTPNVRHDRLWSIDRIDNARPHVKGNVRIVCWKCNCSHTNLVGV